MKRRTDILAISILVGVFCVSTALAQSYGPEDQVLTIGAAAFQADHVEGYIDSDGYLYNGGVASYYHNVPLSLPEGALIAELCLYANDSDPGNLNYVGVKLEATKLVPGGETPFTLGIPESVVTSTSNIGYGYYCTQPFSFTLKGKTDVDGDGNPDALAYYVHAYIPPPSQSAVGLGGVRITWKRQVSPPPQTPTFGDVPATDGGFPFIEALVASGITAGCNAAPPLYCPDANLTRRQMAVFLAKALGLHWTD